MSEVTAVTNGLDDDGLAAARRELAVYERTRPDVAALATITSLARTIEPELLRSLRLELGSRITGTRITVAAESGLWFSRFIESRGADGITLVPETLQVVRPRLAADRQLLQDARAIIEDMHQSAPDVLQWEERIIFYALTGQNSLLEEEALRGIRSIAKGTRLPLANWISAMWPRLPPEACRHPLIVKLHRVAAGLTLRRVEAGGTRSHLILDFSSLPSRELGIILLDGQFVVGDVPEAEWGIPVPDFEPVELDVLPAEQRGRPQFLSIPRGDFAVIAQSGTVRIRTMAGQVYELSPDLLAPRTKQVRRAAEQHPIVFISYSHDSDAHRERVLELSERLRKDGIETVLDQYVSGTPKEGWPRWMLHQLDAADYVLVVCTETYYRRFRGHETPGGGKGVDWEGALVTQELYDARSRTPRFVPVLFSADATEFIPERLRSFSHYTLASEAEYHSLLGFLLGRPGAPPRFADISRIIKYAPAELVGREAETKILDDAWEQAVRGDTPRPHVLTFVALAGEGKTSLAAKWAAELAHRDWPGCEAAFAWSFYSQGTREQLAASSDLFLAAALIFFGDPETAGSAQGAFDKGRRLAQLVGQRRALLVLDGLEPLQYAPTSPTPGELKDQGLAALLKGLAGSSRGLCVVTTRYSIPDLKAFWQTTAPEHELKRLSLAAGVALLKKLGVHGTQPDFEKLVEDVKGHALILNLLGSYLHDAHAGDIGKCDLVKLEEADAEERGGHAFRVMDAYVRWFASDQEKGQRALAVLQVLGLFDRPVTVDVLAVLQEPPAIPGLTNALVDMTEAQRNLTVTRLEAAYLLTVNRDAAGTLVSLDAHPLVREYFAHNLETEKPKPRQDAYRRLYEHLRAVTSDRSQPTIEDLLPLAEAVRFGCSAGLHQQAFDEVYWQRIQRQEEAYAWRRLGAFGFDLSVIACFFDEPWSRVAPALSVSAQGAVLHGAAFSLRALGRPTEALEPMRAALEMGVKQESWKEAARRASNLSELELTLGEVAGAVGDAEQSVTYADRSGDAFEQMVNRTTHADALHQAGRQHEAEMRFREAEAMQAESQPAYPLLRSLSGFRYCDLLLTEVERAAIRADMKSRNSQEEPRVYVSLREILNACRAISRRAAQTLKWDEEMPGASILDYALHRLTLGRAALYEAVLAQSVVSHQSSQISSTQSEIEQAVSGLRRAGQQQFLPLGLLTRAWVRLLTDDRTGARTDLDEAWEVAARGPMPLFMADIHLYRARLFGKDLGVRRMESKGKDYPWESPAADLAEAGRLVERHGYHRRDEELADAEQGLA